MSHCPTVIQVYPACALSCPDVPVYVFQNANLAGEGVFFQNVDNTISFFGIENTDGAITVTLDAVNNAISLDLNAELLAGNFPDATTTSKGKVELAIDAEAVAKTSTTVVLTPSNLAALGATSSFAGFVELATNAETAAFSSSTLAVTPAGLGSVVGSMLRMGAANATTNSTSLEMDGNAFTFTTGATSLSIASTSVTLTGSPLSLGAGGDLNFNGAKVQLGGVDIPANAILTTAGAGVPGYILQTAFITVGGTTDATLVNTDIDVTGGALTILASLGAVEFANAGTTFTMPVNIDTGGKLNFRSGGRIQLAGFDVPADSFIRTDSAAGVVTSELCALYFGPNTVTEDYPIAPFIANRGFDPSTVTLPDLAVVVASLIQDLAAVHKPIII